ncbi:MAG: DEAD/DEAH box helicase [Minisyncoccia bacterium]
MEVRVTDNSISILSAQKTTTGQISFWGFTKDSEGVYTLQTNEVASMLEKVLDFFDTENLTYTLSLEAENIKKDRTKVIVDFSERKKVLEDFKHGIFDKQAYQDFTGFLSKNLVRSLKEHQKKSAYHLYLARNGANFSVPGSGKTSVVLSVFEKLRAEGIVDTLFVIGPPASFGPWRKEFEATIGRKPTYRTLAGGDRQTRSIEYYPDDKTKAELYLTTFQTVLKDQDEVIRFLSSRHINAFLVVDEAHYMKRLIGNWANAVMRLASSASVRCVLTGTPLPRSHTDIFNLFDFLWPNNKPISESQQHMITVYEKDQKYDQIKQILDTTVGPLFYRVRKSDLNLTKPVFHDPIKIRMNNYERKIYDAIENKIREENMHDEIHDFELVLHLRRGRLMRLRQASSYIGLLKSSIVGYEEVLYDPASDIGKYIHAYDEHERPAKLEYLLNFLKELKIKGEKIVIWSNFLGTIDLIQKTLIADGLKVKIITGATPVEQMSISEADTREKIRDEFVDPNSGLDILIANPGACAESISLHTTCHHALYYDLSYNCAQYLQSLDRIHRVGGSEKILAHYHFLQYDDTIDEDVKSSLDRKARQMYQVIDQDYAISSLDISNEDELEAYERIFSPK